MTPVPLVPFGLTVILSDRGVRLPRRSGRRRVFVAALLALGLATPLLAQGKDVYGDALPRGAVQRLGCVRCKYGGINDVAYLPDGRVLVLVGSTLDVWDMATGTRQEQRRLPVSAVAMDLSRDAARLLLAAGDGSVCHYDLATGKELRRWPTAQAGLKSARLSPDGTRVLTVGRMPPTLKEWELATGRELAGMSGKLMYYDAAVYALGGKVAVAGGGYDRIEFWDLTAGNLLQSVASDYCVYDMVPSADGTRVLAGERSRGSEWDVALMKPLQLYKGHHGGAVTSQCYGPNPGEVYTGSRDGSVRRWDRVKATVLGRWFPHASYATKLRVSPDGKWVLSYGSGQYLVECDLETGKPRLPWERHEASVDAVAWTAAGRVISGSLDGTARVWEPLGGKCLAVLPAGPGASCVTGTPDGQTLAVGSKDSLIREYAADGTLRRELKGHRGYVRALAYLPDGRLVSCADDGTVRLWGPGPEALSTLEGHRGGVLALVTLDEQHVATAGRDGSVRLWDLAAGRQVWSRVEHRGYVTCLSAGPQASFFSSGRDGRILHWNVAGKLPGGELTAGGWVNALAATADGTGIFAGSGKLLAWELPDGTPAGTREGHAGAVNALALSPDGKHIVSASADGTLLVWSR